jgi:hypothetical protein
MTPDRWRQVEEFYHAALEHDPAERFHFLAQACAGDDALRREVESLLALDEGAEHFIDTPPSDLVAAILANDDSKTPPIGGEPGEAAGTILRRFYNKSRRTLDATLTHATFGDCG